MSCAPKNPQPLNSAWSPDILMATACAPSAPGVGIGAKFYFKYIQGNKIIIISIIVSRHDRENKFFEVSTTPT